jgi:hypothetical protein
VTRVLFLRCAYPCLPTLPHGLRMYNDVSGNTHRSCDVWSFVLHVKEIREPSKWPPGQPPHHFFPVPVRQLYYEKKKKIHWLRAPFLFTSRHARGGGRHKYRLQHEILLDQRLLSFYPVRSVPIGMEYCQTQIRFIRYRCGRT